jgi:tellurite methyltransferase
MAEIANDRPDFVDIRQKWDDRYTALHPVARRQPTDFARFCTGYLPKTGYALDIAAGAGRHTIMLAQHGLWVDAVDISWEGLRLARQRSALDGVTGKVQFIAANVERGWLPRRQYQIILVSYFLYRPLMPLIKSRLAPGGWLVYETFTLEQLQKSYHRGSKRADLYLQPGELYDIFSEFTVHHYDEGDHRNRMTAQLLARKP